MFAKNYVPEPISKKKLKQSIERDLFCTEVTVQTKIAIIGKTIDNFHYNSVAYVKDNSKYYFYFSV